MKLLNFRRKIVPSLDLPLQTTIVQRKGVGTPTFTRASTATVTDHEGILRTAKSGEARFEGARRVENLIPTPSNTLAIAGTKTVTVTAGVYVFSMGAGASSGVATFSGTSGASGQLVQHATKRVSAPLYVEAGTIIITASVATLNDLQLEQVTGQANQNPSEYVSVGGLSAPYHGANVDGVKYFTTENGNTVANNVVTEATGAAIPDATLKGYVAEGSRTNLLTYSEQFDNAAWAKSNSTITADTTVAPDGKSTADKLVENTATSQHKLLATDVTATTGLDYTFTAYAKASERTKVDMSLSGYTNWTGSNGGRTIFDLNTVTATWVGTAGISNSIVSVGDGWYRCSITVNRIGSTGVTQAAFALYTTSSTYTGDGTSGLYVWGAQLEQASFASSYIPTTSASVTRNAGILSNPVSNILATQGSLYFEFRTDRTPIGTVFFFGSYLDANNYFAVLHDGTNLIARKKVAGVDYDSTIANPFVASTNYKVGVVWTTTKLAIFLNGVKGTQDNTAITIVLGATTFEVGSNGNSANHAFASIINFKTWKKPLPDARLIGLTS